MHRMHHAHADTERDPHAPSKGGLLAMIKQQSAGAQRVYRGLRIKEAAYMKHATDLDFEIHPLLMRYVWWVPFFVHAIVGTVLAVTVGWLFGVAYFVGITSHPITGACVNYFGHTSGRRNFETHDVSTNNLAIALLILGEGFQNNHHRYPRSATFAYRRSEIDLGYVVCLALDAVGLITIDHERLMPKASVASQTS
jgi:stearoyl-CoA desaturase (delta-9 desaturase)